MERRKKLLGIHIIALYTPEFNLSDFVSMLIYSYYTMTLIWGRGLKATYLSIDTNCVLIT
jgi:hypothetical protein